MPVISHSVTSSDYSVSLVTKWRTTQGLLRVCFNRTRTLNPAGRVRIHKRKEDISILKKV